MQVRVTSRCSKRLNIKCPKDYDFKEDLKRSCTDVRWDAEQRYWHIKRLEEGIARSVLRKHFGTDDTFGMELCDVLIDLTNLGHGVTDSQSLDLFWQPALKRQTSKSPVIVFRGFGLESGEFEAEAGSRRYPVIGRLDGVVLRAYDIPKAFVERTRELGFDVEVVGSNSSRRIKKSKGSDSVLIDEIEALKVRVAQLEVEKLVLQKDLNVEVLYSNYLANILDGGSIAYSSKSEVVGVLNESD